MPVESEVAVAPVSTRVSGVFGSVVPLMVTVVPVVVALVSCVVPAESKNCTVGIVGAVPVRVTIAAVWLVSVPAPALTVNGLAPMFSTTPVKLKFPELSEVAVAPVSRIVTAVFGLVVPLMTVRGSAVLALVSCVAPVELKNCTVGVAGAEPALVGAIGKATEFEEPRIACDLYVEARKFCIEIPSPPALTVPKPVAPTIVVPVVVETSRLEGWKRPFEGTVTFNTSVAVCPEVSVPMLQVLVPAV